MSTPVVVKPLSAYLKGLVEQKSLPVDVAEILNRLPDWKQQREAVQAWKDRLDGPATQVVAEFERKNKGIDTPLDFLLYRNAIQVKQEFYYHEEDFDEYMESMRDAFEQFLEEQACPVCRKSLGGGRHIDCSRLESFRLCAGMEYEILNPQDESKELPHGSPEHKETVANYLKHIYIVEELEKRLTSGYLKDGTPWNAPKTNTELKNEKLKKLSEPTPDPKTNGNGHAN
jgi:hypothetical protein